MRKIAAVCLAGLFLWFGPSLAGQEQLKRDDLLRLHAAGVSEQTILKFVQTTGSRFELAAADLVELRQAGLSDGFLRALLERNLPAAGAQVPASGNHRTLSIETEDRQGFSIILDSVHKRILIYEFSSRLDTWASRARPLELELEPGEYAVSWVGGRKELVFGIPSAVPLTLKLSWENSGVIATLLESGKVTQQVVLKPSELARTGEVAVIPMASRPVYVETTIVPRRVVYYDVYGYPCYFPTYTPVYPVCTTGSVTYYRSPSLRISLSRRSCR